MLPRERVIKVINHEKPDRIPVYGWVGANLGDQISEAYGSVAAFEDKYEFDFAHILAGLGPIQEMISNSCARIPTGLLRREC